MSEETNLVVIEDAALVKVFEVGGSKTVIDQVKAIVADFEPDIATDKGRKAIASIAHKVAKTKTRFDGLGKDSISVLNEQVGLVNTERKAIRDELDIIRDEVRKPLTDWESAEKKRVADIEARIANIVTLGEYEYECSSDVSNDIKAIENVTIDDSFEEFELAATKAKAAALTQLEAKFIVLQNAEKEAAEAKRLEEERIEKERIEREELIAKEAAEQATKDAEEKAKAEQEEKDKAAQKAIDKAKQATLDAELAAATADREKREAVEQAEKDQAQAIEDERARVNEEKRLDDAKELKRQENVTSRNKIHKQAKASLMEHGISEKDATIFVTMVKDGLVKNITINY